MRPADPPHRPGPGGADGQGGPGGPGGGTGTPPVVPILLYHSVTAEGGGLIRRYTMAPGEFRAHMAWVARQGYSTLTVSQYAAALRGEAALPARPLVVTFDDGYADFLDGAAPALAEHAIRATLYVTTAPIGETRRGTLAGRPMLTWSELRALGESGIELGAHGHDHVQLDLVSRRAVANQVRASKRLIEDHVQVEVRSFAYPHGHHTPRVRDAVRDAGYASACAVKNALSHPRDDLWALGRIMLEHDDTVERLRATCGDGARPLSWHGERLRTRGWRAVRRARTILRPGTLTSPATRGD